MFESLLLLLYDVLSLGVYEAGQRIYMYMGFISGRPAAIVMFIMSRKWDFNFGGIFHSCAEELFVKRTKKLTRLLN